VSVIEAAAARPYGFIDLPADQCVQGIDVDPALNTVNGTTHVGQKMWTFDSATDTIRYSVDIRPAFDAFVAGLPRSRQFAIPEGWILHLHDLATDRVNHRAYQTIHTIAAAGSVAEDDESAEVEVPEISGRWVAEVDTNPSSSTFRTVRIIDLSNGQSVPAVPEHDDAVATGRPFNELFVHAHFVAVDPARKALLVSGEHTGNLAVVDTNSRNVAQVLSISRRMASCTSDETEPHVHGVNIQKATGIAYVSDEGEDCFYESVTILEP